MENDQPTDAVDIKQKKPHVPKFGDWDSENISYTACFESARKDGVRRNPNDPEENPEAFKGMIDSQASRPPNIGTSSSSKPEKVHKIEGDIGHPHRQLRRSNVVIEHRRTASGSRKSYTSGSDRSNSEYALMRQQSRHRRQKSERRKSFAASGSDHSLSNSQSKNKNTTSSSQQSSNLSHDTHTRVASIPKFGDWDEKDPKSGEGFTYIFEQVKEEKKNESNLPPMPQGPSNDKRGKSSKSKSWCCLF